MPGGKHDNMQAWSPEEDTIILDMHTQLGPMWSKIVRQLPGRTVSSVRNRWQRIEKGRKQREAGIVSKNRCHACGQPKRGHVCLAKLGGGPNVAMGPPSVTITNQLGVYVPTVMAPAGPPAIRRTRSNTSVDNLQELLRDSAQPVAVPQQAAPEAALPQPPMVRRNQSVLSMSFFEELNGTTERSDDETRRQLLKLAAESEGRSGAPMMPPALKRVVSGEAMAPPKMTRSNSAYLREMAQGLGGASSSSSSITALPPPAIGVPPGLAPPMVGARRSSEWLQEGLDLFGAGQLPGGQPLPNLSFSGFFGEGGSSRAQPPLALPSNLGQDFTGGAVAGHKRPADVLLDAPPVSRRRSGRSPSPRDSPRP